MTTKPWDIDVFDTLELTRRALTAEQNRSEQLQEAVHSNRRIGIATGIVMLTENLDPDQAFERLRRTSMDLNRRLAELAEDVIYLRHCPAHAGPFRRR